MACLRLWMTSRKDLHSSDMMLRNHPRAPEHTHLYDPCCRHKRHADVLTKISMMPRGWWHAENGARLV